MRQSNHQRPQWAPFLCCSFAATLFLLVCAGMCSPGNAQQLGRAHLLNTVVGQSSAPAMGQPGTTPELQQLRRRRGQLQSEQSRLLRQQAQLAQGVAGKQQQLELPKLPYEKQVLRCEIMGLHAEQQVLEQKLEQNKAELNRLQRRINRMSRSLARVQQAMPAPPARPSTPPPDPLGPEMVDPVNPIIDFPPTVGRRIIAEDGDDLFSPPGTEFDFIEQEALMLVTLQPGASGSFGVKGEFRISDGSKQAVRLRWYVDSSSAGGPPVGLYLTRGPTMMNDEPADTLVMWGPLVFQPIPAGYTGTGRMILDVPSDSTIKELEIAVKFQHGS